MTSVSFENSPLVELIAELRWAVPGVSPDANAPAGVPTFLNVDSKKVDEFFMRFGGAVYSDGFCNVEKLVPPNFPSLPFQVACRFSRRGNGQRPVLYQVGVGIFTANATPPYKSWEEFAPEVEKGLLALIDARSEDERESPFFSISLRYIDAFGPDLTGGRDVTSFVADVLKIKIELPKVLLKDANPDQGVKPYLQFQLPLKNGMNMIVGVGEGMVGVAKSIILDMTVSSSELIEPNVESVMSVLNGAREMIHDAFMGLTAPIHDLMQPAKEGGDD